MTEGLISAKMTIGNRMGLHARPAAQMARMAGQYQAKLTLHRCDRPGEADCSSVLALLMLAASQGTVVELTAEGSDAPKALQAFQDYFSRNFDEE